MAVDSATSEKEISQWPLARTHWKKKSHNGNGLSCNGSCTALHGFGNRAMAVETRTRPLETQLRQFHIQTSHQTPEIARAQAQCGRRNLKVAGGIDYGALDESPLEVIDARIETAGRI